MLHVEALSFTIKRFSLLKNLSFTLRPGELLAVCGANGAGKSTLMGLLSGQRQPSEGRIRLNGHALGAYAPEAIALKRAFLSQQTAVVMDFTVREVIAMGRYPHFGLESARNDEHVTRETMAACGLEALEDRVVNTLSGGEQQRVHLARVLAQLWDQPGGLLLLDEPVAALDLQYQHEALAIARSLACHGFMVIAVLHELNLAAQYADRILLLKHGRRWKEGTPAEVLTPNDIYTVFDIDAQVMTDPHTLTPFVLPRAVKRKAAEFNSVLI